MRRTNNALKGKTDVSITAWGPTAIEDAETVDNVKPAILPAAVFIIVEIVLVAETISVILLKEMDPRNPAAAPIAILLSVALLANLGLVCSVAAASAADSVRRSNRARARALSGRFAAVGAPAEGTDSADVDLAGVDFPAPASVAFPECDPARPTDSEDHAVGRGVTGLDRATHPPCPLAGR